jgi:hypothetical protein
MVLEEGRLCGVGQLQQTFGERGVRDERVQISAADCGVRGGCLLEAVGDPDDVRYAA